MTKYDQSCIVNSPAAQQQMHVVCTASSVSYVTCYSDVHILLFYSHCIMHAAANLLKRSICGLEQPATLELHQQMLRSLLSPTVPRWQALCVNTV